MVKREPVAGIHRDQLGQKRGLASESTALMSAVAATERPQQSQRQPLKRSEQSVEGVRSRRAGRTRHILTLSSCGPLAAGYAEGAASKASQPSTTDAVHPIKGLRRFDGITPTLK
ncbi:hypothetical protein NDU88_009073 [Pleurodeles waltl]|uniref:Uncharacterized protein n=1 Tax=Pleurodeles waltl TaxID=8319 RepID=A0AAV7NZU3_PLEWA|nr:hypothetical protein NDU88_009073 [Pleurodeles waltl]